MSQIFKKQIPKEILFNFLEEINCQKSDKYYILDVNTYKKTIYNKNLEEFIDKIREYYYVSKHHYIDKNNINHNRFNTIIRQICKSNAVEFSKYIKYDKSTYSVVYNIFFENLNVPDGTN